MNVIVRNSVFMSLFNLFGRASGFIRYVLLYGLLSPADFSLITFAIYVGKLARHFMDGGLDNLISRDGARAYDKVPEYYLHGLVLKSLLGIVFAIGCYFYLKEARDLSLYELIVIYVCIFGSAMVALNGVIRSCFTAIERMEYVFYTNLPSRLIALLLLFLALWFSLPLVYVSISVASEFVIWFFVLGLVSLRFFHFESFKIRFSTIRYMCLESWPLALYGFFNVLYLSLDVIMIEYIMGGRDAVGAYTSAGLLVEGFTLFLTGYMIAIYPALSRYYNTDEKAYEGLFQQSLVLMLSYTIPLTFLLAFWPHEWLNLIRKPDPISGDVLRVLCINLNLSLLNTMMIIVFTSRNRQTWLVLFTGLAVGVSYLSNWFMIHWLEQLGAAYATLFSQAVLLIIMASMAKKMFKLKLPWQKPLGLLIVSSLSGFLLWIIPGLPILTIPFLYITLLGFLTLQFGIYTRSDIKHLIQAIRPKKEVKP